jgi:hypothetical protein
MDAEDFQIWKESTATQWVLSRVLARANGVKAALAEELYHSTNLTPAEWAALQARAGFDRGLATGMETVCNLEFEEINDAPPAET